MSFPPDYPNNPPSVRFTTDIWHPNGTFACPEPVDSARVVRLSCRPTEMMRSLTRPRGAGAVYPDGRVCISILHAPGNDPNGYEQASERWSPIQTVETIMLSIISMLSSPNDESPANIDAAVRAHPNIHPTILSSA